MAGVARTSRDPLTVILAGCGPGSRPTTTHAYATDGRGGALRKSKQAGLRGAGNIGKLQTTATQTQTTTRPGGRASCRRRRLTDVGMVVTAVLLCADV